MADWIPHLKDSEARKAARIVSRFDNMLSDPQRLFLRLQESKIFFRGSWVGIANERAETRGDPDQRRGAPAKCRRKQSRLRHLGSFVHHDKRDTIPNAMPWRPLRDGDILKPPDWRLVGVKTCQNAMYRSNMAVELSLSHLEHHELRQCHSNRSSTLGAQERARSAAALCKPTLASWEDV